jgi:hypothetical protein
MEPLGLTIKRDGSELMIVHRCTGCGKIGKNRTAGDDNATSIVILFEASLELDSHVKVELEAQDISLCLDRELVEESIWGQGGAS